MTAYYNEIDPFAAQWLRNLIAAGLIAPGDVDERSIADVQPDDLAGYGECHFFAGIGGWSYALRLAGWPDRKPVWTGSCPCQPFSAAGHGKAESDERHLWPEFARLIGECQPATVFGEQVASKLGRDWLANVQTDMEAMGYAVASADLCAAGVGAPHIRQRLWFVGVGDGINARLEGYTGNGDRDCKPGWLETDAPGSATQAGSSNGENPHNGFWRDADWLGCRDGKLRPVEPGTFPLAYGVSQRVGRLRGYGNAIVPQVAAQFIGAYMEIAS